MLRLNYIFDCIGDLLIFEFGLILITIIIVAPEDLQLILLVFLCCATIILSFLINEARKSKSVTEPEPEKCVRGYEIVFRYCPLVLFLLLFFFLTISVFGLSLNKISSIIFWLFVSFTIAEIVSYKNFDNDLSKKRLLLGIVFIISENTLLLLFFGFTDIVSKSGEEGVIIGKFLMPVAFFAIQSLLFYFHSTINELKVHLFKLKEWIGFPS